MGWGKYKEIRFIGTLFVLSCLFTLFCQRMRMEEIWAQFQGKSENTDLTQLLNIVAKEVPAEAPEEVLKAQCVIARTNLRSSIEKGTKIPDLYSEQEQKNIWGDNYERYRKRIEEAIKDTREQTLWYQENYIYAAYHAVSSGNTRNMWELYPESNMPYLCQTNCPRDRQSEDYISVYVWEKEDFLAMCREMFLDCGVQSMEEIEAEKRDQAGYVLSMRVGEMTCSGEEFREKLGLVSSNFSISDLGEDVRIITLGKGHGFGMSQYEASVMAQEGKNYTEILQFFYPGVELKE